MVMVRMRWMIRVGKWCKMKLMITSDNDLIIFDKVID